MIGTILLIIIFVMGIYFGSFYTLATYRIPKKENITHKHSYCPNCNHKLGIFDLVPIFSYIFLMGKCRYCKNPIGVRYFIFEFFTGIVFVLFALSLNINVFLININTIVYFFIATLYFTFLFITAGIEKEKSILCQSVLIFGVIVSIVYIIYSYTLVGYNGYEYVIYLMFMILLVIINIKLLKKSLKNSYYIQLIILMLNILVFTGPYIMISTILLTILSIGIKNILIYLKNRKTTKVISENTNEPIGFYICVSNLILILGTNFIMNYWIK